MAELGDSGVPIPLGIHGPLANKERLLFVFICNFTVSHMRVELIFCINHDEI